MKITDFIIRYSYAIIIQVMLSQFNVEILSKDWWFYTSAIILAIEGSRLIDKLKEHKLKEESRNDIKNRF